MPTLYCRCAYAQVVPEDTKNAVLERLCNSGQPFSAVSDLCEMSARRDPKLLAIASTPDLKIAACHERAVRWLFHAAEAPLPEDATIVNLRELDADTAISHLLS